jgi:glutamate 5-kinase
MNRRLVIKFGTGVLAKPGGGALDAARFASIADEIAAIVAGGHPCVIVSSAAIAAGVAALGLARRPEDLPGKQACAAVGQPRLMRLYDDSFKKHGFRVAQLLLTHGDIDSRTRRANARITLERLLESRSVIPVINENDSVAVEEMRFGDNDQLSAEVAVLVGASRLILASSTDGVVDSSGRRLRLCRDLDRALELVRPEKGAFSVGGMRTKLEAVRTCLAAGIPATIVDGRKPGGLLRAAAGGDGGTRFPVPRG